MIERPMQPMETAPRDMKNHPWFILLWTTDSVFPTVGLWSDQFGKWQDDGGFDVENPIGWNPMPRRASIDDATGRIIWPS